ncbi:MAG TPA: serine hydrolase [Vicinamibacterales bacterium]|nr:serine hydrolase [Vicinamibacterales bacterium]
MRSALRAVCGGTLAFALMIALPGAARQPSSAHQQGSLRAGQQPPAHAGQPAAAQGQQPPAGGAGEKPRGKRGQKPETKPPQLPEAQRRLLPDTTPGKLLGEWLAICGKPSVELMTKWHQDHLRERFLEGVEPRAVGRADAVDCFNAGGLQVTEVVRSTQDNLVVLAHGPRLDTWFRLALRTFEDGKSGPVQAMPATPPESSVPKDLRDPALQKEIDRSVQRLHAADAFSGIVMASRDGTPFITSTAGDANRTRITKFTPSSQFTIGSMGKMFTAAAFARLVDQGKASFDDTVGTFFPEFANETVRDKVTVAMLLTHTSGMGDFLGRRTAEMMKSGVKRASEFMPLYEKDEPAFEPGKGSAYSNAGLALVGAIVEKVSGEDYPDYLRKHVFEPAGMVNSHANNVPLKDPLMVVPYTKRSESGPLLGWIQAQRDIGSPAGGAVSTAEDLLKFAEALRGGRLVSKATFEKMSRAHEKTPTGGAYGYAMNVADIYGRTVVGHGGGFPGVSAQLYIVLDTPYAAVVLSNQDPPAAEMVGERLRAMLVKKAEQEK